ncbi:MAG: hypothetical protein RLO52_22185 [Sandaracinaceae bacterium]
MRGTPERGWESLPSEALVRLVVDGDVLQWKPLCAELARRPPDEAATRVLLEAPLPAWTLIPILAASPHGIAYDALRGFARDLGNVVYANEAARGMARAHPAEALEELARWLRDEPSLHLRGVAAVGLTAIGTREAAAEIALGAASERVGTLLAGQLLGRMASGADELVVELLESADPRRWRTGAEAALARWRAAPDDALVDRWRPHVEALLARESGLDGPLRRGLTRWVEPPRG